jgi:cytosine/adenosine deaminase-related metal-dependent hydrolase
MRHAGIAACFSLAAFLTSPVHASLLVTNGTFLTMKPGETEPVVGYMLVDDRGRIAALAAGAPPAGVTATTTLDGSNRIIIPAFISAHSHLWQSAFRGLGKDQYVDGWGVALRVYTVHATDEDLYWFTLHGALDHLRHGITSVFNFGYNHRPGEYNDAQLRALLDSGMRFVHAFAQARTLPVEDQYRSFLRYYDFAKAYRSEQNFLRVGITGSGANLPQAKLDRRLMDEFGALNETHYLELPVGKERQQQLFQNFIEAGTLGPNQFFGHFIHTNDAILAKTAAAGSGMSWQPLSNGRLGSGIADIPKYLSRGVKVGMGVDGEASADVDDPFENMRAGIYALRARSENAAIMQPLDVLRLHTLGSAEVMGIADKLGSLEVGKLADFAVIVPPTPVFDAAATVVFACSSENLEAVYVGGEKLAARGALTRSDMAKTTAEVDARVNRIRSLALRQ